MKLCECLLFVLIFSSCAYRTKGQQGILETRSIQETIGYSTSIAIKYPDYVDEIGKKRLQFFPVNEDADFVITKIVFKEVPPRFICATGYPIPFLISFVTFGLIPVHETISLSGIMYVQKKGSSSSRKIKFEAKRTASWSLWNRMKVGNDPEWSRLDESNENYFEEYLASKILR